MNVTRASDLMASAAPTRFAPTHLEVSLAPVRLDTLETLTLIATVSAFKYESDWPGTDIINNN